ncbi:MAG: outer membrane beta-barrel protein [Bryobacterales bacterium]|nr:outer membrane beta-barrel protein [Bryobacterales bacterium]
MRPIRNGVVVPLFFALAGGVSAQVLEIGPQFGVSRLSNNKLYEQASPPAVVKLNSGFRFGFRVTLNAHEYAGHEVGYAYNRTNLDLAGTVYGMATHQGFYDFLLYARPEGSKVRPFIAGGAQFSNFVPPGSSVSYGGGEMKFGINYGAGVKVRTSDRFLIRLDFRQYMSPKPDFNFPAGPQGWLRLNEISAGFSYTM